MTHRKEKGCMKRQRNNATGVRGFLKKAAACCMAAVLAVSSFNVIPSAPKAAEADYTMLAKELPLNGTWSGDTYLTDINTEYWYRLTVPSDGLFTYKLMYYVDDIHWCLYNNDLSSTIDEDWGSGGTETAPKTAEESYSLSAGTYYLKVMRRWEDNGRFKVFASHESYGANDAGANSYDSPFKLTAGTEVTGALTETDKEDWYQLTVPSDGHYSVKVTSYNSETGIYLYNSDLSKTIGYEDYLDGSVTAPSTKNFNYVLTAGTYYIKIRWNYKKPYGKYLLSWNALTPDNCVHEYEEKTVYSTYTQPGYTLHTCKNCGHTYQDNYQEKLTLGKVSLYTVRGHRKKLYVYYSTVSGAYGYQIRVSRNRSFSSGVKRYRATSGSRYNGYLNKLKRKKRYYVQVRAYRTEGGVAVYGSWSNRKSARTK